MSVGLPWVSLRRSYFLPWVSVRTRAGLVNGWSSTVAACVFASIDTSAMGFLLSLSLPPQADRVSAAATTSAAAGTIFLTMEHFSWWVGGSVERVGPGRVPAPPWSRSGRTTRPARTPKATPATPMTMPTMPSTRAVPSWEEDEDAAVSLFFSDASEDFEESEPDAAVAPCASSAGGRQLEDGGGGSPAPRRLPSAPRSSGRPPCWSTSGRP